jgi:hypothetical protein
MSSTLAQKVASSFSVLSSAASDLNAVSDKLGKSVTEIDAALKKLNLGIAVWVKVVEGESTDQFQDSSFWSEDLGYAKINGKWGLSLRRVDGDYRSPDEERVEAWLFSDAPRALRLTAIDKIPELLEELSRNAVKYTVQIQNKLADVQSVAAAVNPTATAAGEAVLPAETSKAGTKPGALLSAMKRSAAPVGSIPPIQRPGAKIPSTPPSIYNWVKK